MLTRSVAAAAMMVLLAGCGGATEVEETSAATASEVTTSASLPASPTTTSTTSEAPSSTSTAVASPSTSPSTTTTTTTSLVSVEEPIIEPTLGPAAESIWMVVGVQHDDRLNVRAVPGVGGDIVASLAPTEREVVAHGTAVVFGQSIWWELSASGADGWSNARYLGAEGATTDVTAAVVRVTGGIPSATTMEELAEIVIESRWIPIGSDGEFVVVKTADIAGSIGEITVDVFPAEPDDSIRGARLVVFGQLDDGSGPFALKTVEETTICWRGADGEGLCV